MEIVSIIISVIALAIGIINWFVNHKLAGKRDSENRKKEIRIQYLIDAFKLVEDASNRKDTSRLENIEKAGAIIHLLGT